MNAKFKTALIAAFVAGTFASAPSFASTVIEGTLDAQPTVSGHGEAKYEDDGAGKREFEAEVDYGKFPSDPSGSTPTTLTATITHFEAEEPYANCTLDREVQYHAAKKKVSAFWTVEFEVEGFQVNEDAPIFEDGSCDVVPSVADGDVVNVYDGSTLLYSGVMDTVQ